MPNHDRRVDRQALVSVAKVQDEHLEVNGLLLRLRKATSAQEVVAEIDQAKPLLIRHFKHEEGPEGAFALIQQRLPDAVPQVAQLINEHHDLLRHLDNLKEVAPTIARSAGNKALFKKVVQSLITKIENHERLENSLMHQAGLEQHH